jgi:hypothetical protein
MPTAQRATIITLNNGKLLPNAPKPKKAKTITKNIVSANRFLGGAADLDSIDCWYPLVFAPPTPKPIPDNPTVNPRALVRLLISEIPSK